MATSFTGTVMVATEGRLDSLINGYYYINLHTTAFPDGEIRGDIKLNHDKN